MNKLRSFSILILVSFAVSANAATIFKKVKSTISGTIADSGLRSSTIDRRTITYPQNCEMTYSLHAYCGDGDVANYYAAAGNTDEEYGKGAGKYTMVLGYWIEPMSGPDATHVPNKDNWFAVGYDHLALDTSHVGVQVINSNRSESSTEVLKKESERIVALAAMLDDSDQYRMFVAPMLCNDSWTETAEPTAGAPARDAGMLPEGTNAPFGGQICDDAALASANAVPGLFSPTPTVDVPCPALPASTSTCTYSYAYSTSTPAPGAAPVTSCFISSSCVSAPPPTGVTPPVTGGSSCTGSNYTATPLGGKTYPTAPSDCPSGSTYAAGGGYVPPMCYCGNYVAPTPTPAPTPVATPAPTPVGTPPPTCTGSVYAVNGTNGGEPMAASDCPGGTNFVPGYTDYSGYDPYNDPYGYGYMSSGYYNPGYCTCTNYVPPTPVPTPVPPSCATVQASYISTYGSAGQCDSMSVGPGSISCSVYSGHIYLTDSCVDGSYWQSYDGGAPYYNYPYYGF